MAARPVEPHQANTWSYSPATRANGPTLSPPPSPTAAGLRALFCQDRLHASHAREGSARAYCRRLEGRVSALMAHRDTLRQERQVGGTAPSFSGEVGGGQGRCFAGPIISPPKIFLCFIFSAAAVLEFSASPSPTCWCAPLLTAGCIPTHGTAPRTMFDHLHRVEQTTGG